MKTESKNKYSSIPNIITSFRLVGTLALIFVKPFTIPFYVLFTFCGISDVLDGWAARTTGNITEFGSRFDSITDLLFYAVLLLRIFPAMWVVLPKTIWIGVAAIAILRIISYYNYYHNYYHYLNQ